MSSRSLAGRISGRLFLGSLLAACAGPKLELVTPKESRVFVDGQREPHRSLPFRYYGTETVDLLPQTDPAANDYTHVAGRSRVLIAEPASPWLFPFDFPLECLLRLFGSNDRTLVAELPANPTPVSVSSVPDLAALRARAQAARTQR